MFQKKEGRIIKRAISIAFKIQNDNFLNKCSLQMQQLI
jgi:hypothetical protein